MDWTSYPSDDLERFKKEITAELKRRKPLTGALADRIPCDTVPAYVGPKLTPAQALKRRMGIYRACRCDRCVEAFEPATTFAGFRERCGDFSDCQPPRSNESFSRLGRLNPKTRMWEENPPNVGLMFAEYVTVFDPITHLRPEESQQ
jgi:hypothetical protein